MSFRTKSQNSSRSSQFQNSSFSTYNNHLIDGSHDDYRNVDPCDDDYIDDRCDDDYIDDRCDDDYKDDEFCNLNFTKESMDFDRHLHFTGSPKSISAISPSTANKTNKITITGKNTLKNNGVNEELSSKPIQTSQSIIANIIRDPFIIATIAFVLMAVIGYFCINIEQYSKMAMHTRKSRNKCSYDRFLSEYPRQGPLIWSSLEKKLEKAIVGGGDRDDYNVYLFVENGPNDQQYNPNTNSSDSNLLKYDHIDNILKHYEQCLGQRIPVAHLDLGIFTSEKNLNDYGNILEQFRSSYAKSRIIRIATLNKVFYKLLIDLKLYIT